MSVPAMPMPEVRLDDALPRPGAAPAAFELSVLGRFGLHVDGVAVPAPFGKPGELVRLLAARGPLHVETVSEWLWPDSPHGAGRRRLRNVLARGRETSGGLVVRVGEALALADTTAVDAASFEQEAREALAGQRADGRTVDLARMAVERYAGDLLPLDIYAQWAAAPRERLRSRYVALLDLLAEDSRERGRLRESVRYQEQAIASEPLKESRYLSAAAVLAEHGYRGEALMLLRRAAAVATELGLPPSREQLSLQRQLAG